jgi:hypothetical protein
VEFVEQCNTEKIKKIKYILKPEKNFQLVAGLLVCMRAVASDTVVGAFSIIITFIYVKNKIRKT